MRAGKLDHLVAIQRQTEVVQPSGGIVATWSTLATARAEIVRTRADEIGTGFGEAEAAMVVFRIRWRPGITTTDRIIHHGAAFDIREVAEIGRRRILEIRAQNLAGLESV